MLKTKPCVFAVEDTYEIMVPVTKPSLMGVDVGGKTYYDHANGIMRSMTEIHRVTVPMEELDKAGHYTVWEREIIDRKPYFAESEEPVRYDFDFRPLPKDNIRAWLVADAHTTVEAPVAAAKAAGPIDLLIFDGDIPNHSGDPKYFDTIYEIADAITGGTLPCLFARGNHDLRGLFAERFADYTPQAAGRTYYTFRLGSLWGIILDCGEDKTDDHAEYGFTVACHPFREEETRFLEKVCKAGEYNDPEIRYRVVIVHNPFTHQLEEPFNIEPEINAEWGRLLKEYVHPDLMICGHYHTCELMMPGDASDDLGHPCPVLVASCPDFQNNDHTGAVITFVDDTARFTFVKRTGPVSEEVVLPCGKERK